MFVNNLMLLKEKLVTVTPKCTIGNALEIMEKNKFLSIPVSEGNKFIGLISKERIYAYYYEKCLDKKCLLSDFVVENLMRTDVPVINSKQQAEEAAHFLETRSVSFVAVLDDYGDFAGIVTHHAIFHEFTELFGLFKGRRLAVIVYDIQGQISRLTNIITENKGNIISLVVVDPKSLTEVKEVIIRLEDENFDNIVLKVKEAGFKIE
jgi:acetoin utilization protein AcuB